MALNEPGVANPGPNRYYGYASNQHNVYRRGYLLPDANGGPGSFAIPDPSRNQASPFIRQWKDQISLGTVVFDMTPKLGNIILLGAGGTAIIDATPSQTGVTYTRIGRQTVAGNQVECDFWVGVVTSVGAAVTVSRTLSGNGNIHCVELELPLAGLVSASATGGGSGAILTASINGRGDFRYGRRVLTALWYVDRQAMGAVSPYRGWNIYDTGEVVGNVRFRMAARMSFLAAQQRFSAPTGGALNHAAVLGMLR